MSLRSGAKLGPYEIMTPLGAGGMGEVYRARDTKLGRDVALKVLPEAFATDTERMARFEREAQVLASLNHPNIAAIHGLEESGGVRALVMELVEGPTLAELLENTKTEIRKSKAGTNFDFRVSNFEPLAIAKQIAEGLEAAHERGIVHRDLKPANVKITPDGAVKVLDFGLAKAVEGEASSSSNISNSPTLTAAATQAGVILGTAAYMSPEQAKGKTVDRRTDIWAFGCVLYEMLTGERAFTGETVTDVLAGVIRAEPDWSMVPASVPGRIHDLLHRCLTKDPKRRLQAIGDARIAIDETLDGAKDATAPPSVVSTAPAPVAAVEQPGGQRRLPWAIAAALFVALAALVAESTLRKPSPQPSIRASIDLPAGVTQPPLGLFALSPDGRRLAFVAAAGGGKDQLWVRPLDSLTSQPLEGTEGAIYPFWSPDSRYIGFFADAKLKKIDAFGGPAQIVCDAPEGRGGTWSAAGTIVFAPGVFTGISRVAAFGGTPVELTSPPNAGDTDRFPSFLPDGKHVVFLSMSGARKKDYLRVASVDSKEVKTVAEISSSAVYDSSGYLLYQRDGNLVAQRFDKDKLTLSGDAIPVVEKVEFNPTRGNASFSMSLDGMLVYQSGARGSKVQLTWFDRQGNRLGTLGEPGEIFQATASPDGKRVIAPVANQAGKASLWMFDVARGVSSRFTFTDSSDGWPVWSSDGKQVAYTMSHAGRLEIYLKPASGTESEKPLITGEGESMPTDWSRDGRYLAYQTQSRTTKKFDIWILPMTGERKPFPFIATDADETSGTFSPDGRWFAYASDESGRREVYVVQFPGRGGKWQVSSAGGIGPFWAAGGKELDYFTPDRKWMAVEINGKGSDLSIGATQTLFGGKPIPGPLDRGVFVTPDGRKLLMPVEGENAAVPFTLVTNWRSQLPK